MSNEEKNTQEQVNETTPKAEGSEYISIPKNLKRDELMVPSYFNNWSEDKNQKYMEMMNELSTVMRYVAKKLDEYPDFIEDIIQREIAVRTIIYNFVMEIGLLTINQKIGILQRTQTAIEVNMQKAIEAEYMKKFLETQNKKVNEYVE